ncbi:MAG: hypothetical protein ACW99G_11215 [Candidatus Thorarchaeota archaeon]|jgi:hypothetical protein
MSGPSLLQELDRTEKVLEILLTRLSKLNAALEPMERAMKVTDFASSGMHVQGASRGIVCVLSGLIKGDPLERTLSNLSGRGIPALIKSGDRSESPSTIDNIVNMVVAEDQKKQVEFVVNLRWSVLPKPLDKENVAIVGTRYMNGDISRLREELEILGVVVLDDDGEFGGGPLMFEISNIFANKLETIVMELTLSQSLAENAPAVTRILNVFASF